MQILKHVEKEFQEMTHLHELFSVERETMWRYCK